MGRGQSKNFPDENYHFWKDIQKRMTGYSFSAGQILQDLKQVLLGSLDLAKMMLAWILIGMTISGLAAAFVPAEFFIVSWGRPWRGSSRLWALRQ